MCKAIADPRKNMATYIVGPDVKMKNSPSFGLAVH